MRAFLDAYWLRPEKALWFTIASRLIAPALAGKNITEIGIGDGLSSFLTLGGSLHPSFDVFHNAKTEGFWENADIYDHDCGVHPLVTKQPDTRISLGIDHKQNLLNHAMRLGFVDRTLLHDCNEPLDGPFDTVWSNCLYWLRDPIRVIKSLNAREIVCVFPNSDFFRHCTSYTAKGQLWTLLNRGRAESILWHMDLADFEKAVTPWKIVEARTYLSPLTLKLWDVGLRPLSVPLIKMANSLSPESRLACKAEWCDTLERFAEPLLSDEGKGGFNFVIMASTR